MVSQEQEIDRHLAINLGVAALALAGALWCIKAAAIIAIGIQPSLTFETGQLLFPVGVLGVYCALGRPTNLAKSGLILAVLGLVGAMLGLLYPLWPEAQVSNSDEFVFPYSLFVLMGSLGGFVGLLLIAIAILLTGDSCWKRWRNVPLIVALLPLPLITAGAINVEIPIFLIGVSWLVMACALWRVAVCNRIHITDHSGEEVDAGALSI